MAEPETIDRVGGFVVFSGAYPTPSLRIDPQEVSWDIEVLIERKTFPSFYSAITRGGRGGKTHSIRDALGAFMKSHWRTSRQLEKMILPSSPEPAPIKEKRPVEKTFKKRTFNHYLHQCSRKR